MPLLPDAPAILAAIDGNLREIRRPAWRGGEAGRALDRFAGESGAA
ncbi:MAG TPA: hypothetical protein PLQ95_04140 [Thiobacillus sp.]|nr:hypothetical protein [Thiobacillus sp.]